ncbi:hypothetical protein RB598_006413 [Gaeumannomyces tritici]
MPPAREADTIRILVATDNHVGYGEKDPIRRDDSWRTFDEIMHIARSQDVDMVLLGGDLFHDNKPSRKAMYQVMRSLRQNCLGMKPCELEFLCDPTEVFAGAFGHVNYEDPDINISIPVFSIHGNHDDPSGDGHFCSLDLLQVAGLVNYFGRVPEADNIEVRPVLLQKGNTKLALYGISNVRDERMHRTFRDNHVKFFRPSQAKQDWFNLLTVHQNHHAHTATGYLPENFLPDWVDLVVWGHEHECLVDPVENPETGFHVMQPGSSVATSLVPGEAVPKHVAVLNVTGKEFTVDKIPLKSVRPFVTREIVLAQDPKFKKLWKQKPKDHRTEVTKLLTAIVDDMIEQAAREWEELRNSGENSEDSPDQQPLPLIRLKVEHGAPEATGEFEVENPQRFSGRFAERVANTSDLVYFHRRKTAASSAGKTDKRGAGKIYEVTAEDGTLDILKVEELVFDYVTKQSVKILPQKQMGEAVNSFVSKDDKKAIDDVVFDSLSKQVKSMMALGVEDMEVEARMAEILKEQTAKFDAGQRSMVRRPRYKPQPFDYDSDLNGPWEERPEAVMTDPEDEKVSAAKGSTASRGGRGRAAAAAAAKAKADSDDDMIMDDSDNAPQPPASKPTRATRGAAAAAAAAAPKAAARGKKAAAAAIPAAKRGGRRPNPFQDSDDEVVEEQDDAMALDVVDDDDDDDDDGFEEIPPPPPKPAPKRAAPKRAAPAAAPPASRASTRTTGATRQATLNFSQSQRPATQKRPTRSAQKALELSADEISGDDDDDDPFETQKQSSSTRSRRR